MTSQGRTGWDRAARDFDSAADHGLGDPPVREAWRELLLGHLPTPPAAVADLGCGTGSLSVLLAGAGFQVHGVDFSPEMLQRARDKAVDSAVAVAFHEGDAAAPPLPDGAFDVVLCRHVLWALPDPAAALRCWVRLLRPGGRLVLVEGRWGTGGGLSAAETARLLSEVGRQPDTHLLTDPALWGRPVSDERYLVRA